MVSIIKKSISNEQVMNDLTPDEVRRISEEAVGVLSESDVRNFIYRCLSNRDSDKGLAMIDGVIGSVGGKEDKGGLKLVGAAVGTLSVLSESIPELKPRLHEILEHENPSVVACAIGSLVHSSNLDSLYRVYDFLAHDEFQISSVAVKYVENCARDAAFRKRRGTYAIDDEAEAFLRNVLMPLEDCYGQLKRQDQQQHIQKRLSILVAVICNEILDSLDWKKTQGGEVDEGYYKSMEDYLFKRAAPDALPNILRAIERKQLEEGTARSLLNTLGRISNQPAYRQQVLDWANRYHQIEDREKLIMIAENIVGSCSLKEKYVSVPWHDEKIDRNSIVPKTVSSKPPGK